MAEEAKALDPRHYRRSATSDLVSPRHNRRRAARFWEDLRMIFRNTLTCAFAIACSMSATIPAWGQQEAERQVQVDAAIGQTMRLRGHVNYSHGCSDVIPTDITVIQAPLYGTLTIKNEVVHAKDAELGRGCVGSSGMGKVVYYTRAHEGTDSFSYDFGIVERGRSCVRHRAIRPDLGPRGCRAFHRATGAADAGSVDRRRADAHSACARAGSGLRSELPDMDHRIRQDRA